MCKYDRCPQVMSLESASVRAEGHEFENENNLGVWSQKEVSSPDAPLLCWKLVAQGCISCY